MNEWELMEALKMYEAKLREYMTEQEYKEFVETVSKTIFLAEVMTSPSEEFKKIVAEHWDEITAPIEVDDGTRDND